MAYSKRVSDLEFVRLWMECPTYDELVKATGMARTSIMHRAVRLRHRQVNLPPKRERSKTSTELLNAMIAEYQAKAKASTVEKTEQQEQKRHHAAKQPKPSRKAS